MQKLKRKATQGIMLGALVLSIAACGGSAESAGDHKYVVGFSMPTGGQAIQQSLAEALEAAGESENMEVKTVDAQLDPDKQVTDVDQFVAQQVDAIIIFPLAEDSLAPALNRAHEEGIKLIGLNAVLDPDDRDIAPYDATFDQGEMISGAEQLGKYVADEIGGKGNVLGIDIGSPVPSLNAMIQNYQKSVVKHGSDINWLATIGNDTDDVSGAEKITRDAITKYSGEIDAVMAYNTNSSLGAAAAFKSASQKLPVNVSANGDKAAVDAIKKGDLDATIDIVPWREALIGIALTKKVLNDEDVPSWIETPVELYTKENIDKRLDWDAAIKQIEAGELTCANGGCPEEVMSK